MPAKPPTITDLALREVITDLEERNQIPVARSFAQELGFNEGNQIRHFVNGTRNYPRAMVDQAINVLTTKYRVNKNFLLTGHGKMYVGKPYVAEESAPVVKQHENVLSIGARKKLLELERVNEELKHKIAELGKIIKDKDELISMQRLVIQKKKK